MLSTSAKAAAARLRQPLPEEHGGKALWPPGRGKKRQRAAGPKQDQWQIEELVALFPRTAVTQVGTALPALWIR